MIFDVAIVGAGAAGLSAARALGRAGKSVVVLEAQHVAGGRIRTLVDPRSSVPIELGPEFIHGEPRVTRALLGEIGMPRIDEGGTSFDLDAAGGLVEHDGDPFASAAAVLRRGADAAPHETVADVLARVPAEGEGAARLAARLVAGFDAADPARADAREIAEEWAGDALSGSQSRPAGGYGPLVAHLLRTLDSDRVHLRFGARVRAIAWSSRGVEVTTELRGRSHVFRARHAIVTVPIGVLQRASAIVFDPVLPPATLDAIAHIAMGPVVKVILRFRTPFWEHVRRGRFRDGAFFSAEGGFPTFWTQIPQRATTLTAWAGGPAADALHALDRDATVARALAEAGTLFGAPDAAEDECEAAYFYDWQRDPFARGAYSYVLAGGTGARRRLSAPLTGNALLFAGEATATDGEGGTVAGALLSGQRAAALIA